MIALELIENLFVAWNEFSFSMSDWQVHLVNVIEKNAFLVVGFEVYPAVHKPTAVVPGKSGGQALVVRGEKKTRLDQYLKAVADPKN